VRDDYRITRRLLIGQLACLAAWAQNDDDPLRQLSSAHPRLILLDSNLDALRALAHEQPLARRVYADLEKESERLLAVAPVEYKLTSGSRLNTQTGRVFDRVSTLALMYRLTGKDPYLRRAVLELRAAANFRDWNPARFIETAEMLYAFAIGYDWLYNALAPGERAWVRDAMMLKALEPALAAYRLDNGWPKEHLNWNMVCNASVGLGALAIAGDAVDAAVNEKSAAALRFALESIPHGLATYGTEGSWPEGPSYWNLVTRYATSFMAGLQTSLGNDFGLSFFHGVDRAGRFRIHMTGPTGKLFNFGDSAEEAGPAPEMFWLAKRYSVPQYAWSEQKALERGNRPDPYDLVWFDRDAKSPSQPPAWPLDAIFRGVDVACFRSSWDDPNALYLAVKGGDNKEAHTHLDLGSFVFDAGGVRWATDLGPDDFDLPGYFGARRAAYYRIRTEAHNTLLIDDLNQDQRAEARVTRSEFTPDLSWAQIDLSRANGNRVKQWTRRIGIVQRQAVLVGDSLHSEQPVEIIWGMVTDAEIAVSGQTATLHKNGWNLAAEIRTPRHAVFDVAPLRLTLPQSQNPNFHKLVVRLGDKSTELDLNILLTPYRDGQAKPKIAGAQFPV
jgi:hypothetical protein